MADELLTPDLCIIGAGSGGLSLAAGAAQMGARVVLVEGAQMGGDCLNHGCVPSKALLAAAAVAASRGTGAEMGVAPAPAQVDYAAVMAHVARTIAAIAPHDSQERFEGLGVRVIRAWGAFATPREVVAGQARIRARRFVIATGARAAVPPIPGLAGLPYLTNETLFDLREAPAHLLVLGAGPIGLEMAQAHARLGVPVTVIEAARALPREDPELAGLVLARLRAEGVRIIEGLAVARAESAAGGVVLHGADGTRHEGSHLLVATGRRAALARLNLAAAGVAHDDGGVRVGPDLRAAGNARVYAIGDAAGQAQFTHLAAYHAGLVARQVLFGLPARTRAAIPRVTYTSPEIAQIGLTEAEARATHGGRLEVLRAPYSRNDRAIASLEPEGLVKLMAVGGRVVGVSIVGKDAGEQIAPWVLALASGARLGTLAGLVLPYPTRAEALKRAAGAYFSPRLFANPWVKRVVRLVQRLP